MHMKVFSDVLLLRNDDYLRKANIPLDPHIVEDLLLPLPPLEPH